MHWAVAVSLPLPVLARPGGQCQARGDGHRSACTSDVYEVFTVGTACVSGRWARRGGGGHGSHWQLRGRHSTVDGAALLCWNLEVATHRLQSGDTRAGAAAAGPKLSAPPSQWGVCEPQPIRMHCDGPRMIMMGKRLCLTSIHQPRLASGVGYFESHGRGQHELSLYNLPLPFSLSFFFLIFLYLPLPFLSRFFTLRSICQQQIRIT